MIDINMDYDLKKYGTISEALGTIASITIILKDKGFSEEEIMTTLSVMLGFDLKPAEDVIVLMKCMLGLSGNYDNFIKHLIPIANKAHLDIEEGKKL